MLPDRNAGLTPAAAIKVKSFAEPILPDYVTRRQPVASGLTRIQAENIRCAEIEGRREEELLREAESAARRARIARCDAELARIKAQPIDIPDKAYLVAMGTNDWELEKRILEAGL